MALTSKLKRPSLGGKVSKPSLRGQRETTVKTSSSKTPSWLITDKNAQEEIEQENRMSNRRVPEFYLKSKNGKPGTATIQLLSAEPLGMISQYIIPMGGNVYKGVTVPPDEADIDLIGETGKFRPTTKYIYVISDVSGYVKDDGERVRHIPRFFLVGGQIHGQLQSLREDFGDISRWQIKVSVTGSKKKKSWNFVPLKKKTLPSEVKEKLNELADSVMDWYAPPTVKEQKSLLKIVDRKASDSSDDDDED